METIRCGSCRKLLAKALFTQIEIKCPRCGTYNSLRAGSSSSPERPRASLENEERSCPPKNTN